jgi:hypothetical protein
MDNHITETSSLTGQIAEEVVRIKGKSGLTKVIEQWILMEAVEWQAVKRSYLTDIYTHT